MDPDETQAWRLPTAKIEDESAQSDDGRARPGEVDFRPGQPRRQVGIVAEELRVVREVKEAGRQVQQQKRGQSVALSEQRETHVHEPPPIGLRGDERLWFRAQA